VLEFGVLVGISEAVNNTEDTYSSCLPICILPTPVRPSGKKPLETIRIHQSFLKTPLRLCAFASLR